jgi:hypothetical protein
VAERQSPWKWIPALVGAVIGFLFINSPRFLHELGPAAYLAGALFAAVALVAFCGVIIYKNLPQDVVIQRISDTNLPGEVSKLAAEFQTIGFKSATDQPLKVQIAPPALVLPFVHEQERIFGTVYKTETLQSRISFDMFSVFEGDRGSVTTGVLAQGAVMPVAGAFKQVFPNANVQSVFEKHKQAMLFLKGRGILCKPANAQSFEREFRSSILRTRKSFLASPVFFTLTVLWRVITKKSSHLGPIQTQEATSQQIHKVMSKIGTGVPSAG